MEEVHRWRGTAEQRDAGFPSRKAGQFAYFSKQLNDPDWTDRAVLDFGGNAGNLLLGASGAIRLENYYCLDVIREALDEGRRTFPRAHWIHYDRYNCSFNPAGTVDLPIPNMGVEFGLIVAYSVFTHTTREEMHDLVEQLRSRLAPGGALAFTFIDPHYESWPGAYDGNNLKWRLERFRDTKPTTDVDGLLEKSRGAQWCALVDGTELYVDGNGAWGDDVSSCMSYHVYYTAGFLQREYPRATIQPPVNDEMQHCCIFRKAP